VSELFTDTLHRLRAVSLLFDNICSPFVRTLVCTAGLAASCFASSVPPMHPLAAGRGLVAFEAVVVEV